MRPVVDVVVIGRAGQRADTGLEVRLVEIGFSPSTGGRT